MEGTQVTLDPRGSSGADDKSGRTQERVANDSFAGVSRVPRAETRSSATREDWLSLATTDPAFWLKEARL